MDKETKTKRSIFLGWIEEVCNKLPQPGILFIYLFWFTAVLSFVLSKLNVMVINPATEKTVQVQNFFSVGGLYWFLGNLITNFTSFPPLGMVLVMTAAVGMCEESGLIETLLNEKMKHTIPMLVPYVAAFIGILGNIASDSSAIIIPPMVGLFFLAAGRHPISGIICGYAAVQAGFTANLMIAGTDGLLQSITQQVTDDFLGEGVLTVDITCNWYFMAASTLLCTFIIGFMTNHFVETKFGTFVSALLPIGLVLMAAWIVFLFIWMLLGIPVGPGVNIYMP